MGAKSVTKADLVSAIASGAGLKSDAEKALSALTGAVQSALVDGKKVTLVGFGSFSVSHRAARMGRDPQTKKPIQIKASNGVKFKAGKALKRSRQLVHRLKDKNSASLCGKRLDAPDERRYKRRLSKGG